MSLSTYILRTCKQLLNTYPEIAFQVFELTHNGFSGRYCGSIPPPVIRSVSNKLIIRFSTDAEDAGSGFNATYWNEECKCVHHNYDSALRVIMASYRVKSGIFGQTAKFGQRSC